MFDKVTKRGGLLFTDRPVDAFEAAILQLAAN